MYTGEIKNLLQQYGTVLEICAPIGTVYPEEFLPASKEKIRIAFVTAYQKCKGEYRQILAENFVKLARFVPMQEAIIVLRYTNWLNRPSAENFHPEDRVLKDDYMKINDKITDQAQRYINMLRQYM